ncbi:hypothetical protein WJX77_002211 [Trebouxia sp. C0004]
MAAFPHPTEFVHQMRFSGRKDIKICIAKAGGLGLLQDLATANMDQHHLTNRAPWLLHPETKSRIEHLNSLVPLTIFSIVEASSSEDTSPATQHQAA